MTKNNKKKVKNVKYVKSIRRKKINYINKSYNKDYPEIKTCLTLIKDLKKNKNIKNMKSCYNNIVKISKLFPPAKNENKFIYGKLIELELINTFNKFILCTDLDKTHKYGSEYKNDCIINNNKFSIKASKNGGNVTIINKFNKINHKIDINFIICNITKRKLYIFPSLIINPFYIVDKESNIHFKSSIFTYLEKNYKDFIYNFPELPKNILKNLNQLNEIKIYDYLYNKFIL